MSGYYWDAWYSDWGWFLWFGIFFLFFLSVGNLGYTYRAHRKYYDLNSRSDALNILNERYARGEIERDEYLKVKSEIGARPANSERAQRKMEKASPRGNHGSRTPVRLS